jgi:hypothetical protein
MLLIMDRRRIPIDPDHELGHAFAMRLWSASYVIPLSFGGLAVPVRGVVSSSGR